MRQWCHDDEQVAYPTFELINKLYPKIKAQKPGFNNICVPKGLSAAEPVRPKIGLPADLPKAAKDWPNLNFITYHACIRPAFFMYDALQDVKSGKLSRRRFGYQVDYRIRSTGSALQGVRPHNSYFLVISR